MDGLVKKIATNTAAETSRLRVEIIQRIVFRTDLPSISFERWRVLW
jgi:hypothetical protein